MVSRSGRLKAAVRHIRRNFLRWSENFANAVWTKDAGVTITADGAIAPDGSATAQRVQYSGASLIMLQTYTVAVPAGSVWTWSIWVKGTAAQTIAIEASCTGADVNQVKVLTGGWDRLSVVLTAVGAAAAVNCAMHTWSGATARDLHAWGAQLNSGGIALQYARTASAPRL